MSIGCGVLVLTLAKAYSYSRGLGMFVMTWFKNLMVEADATLIPQQKQ